MKIAIASTSKEEGGEISQRGGRAPFYLVYDGEGSLLETIKNPVEQGGGGVGPFVAKMLADKKVTMFMAEKIGPNMVQALDQYGIEYKEMSGNIGEALKQLITKSI